MFREMEEMMRRELEELSKGTPRNLIREKTLPDGTKIRQWGPFIYGYSVTIGPDGKPQIREFGNVKPEVSLGGPKINIREEREPLVDVMETDEEIKVVAELPGVEKKDIKLYGTEDTLTISVDTPERKYYKKVELPSRVDTKGTKASYKNGVLEVTLKKRKEPEGEPILL
ncbi:Hsp20/alpha crystallin family protein [Candidatus Bathyarchaeota archaeon]|nr:Hsp20/alpha crystallin family protein [Candidatus Bathyarchaeota archaeon]RJS87964.1 MAG: Hsp20/alpha crystallin family protein [Candidatus Bathyarchaeota archaeon]